MLQIKSHKRFQKQYNKLSPKIRQKTSLVVIEFASNPSNPPSQLRFHALSGEWNGFYSLSVGGDLRVHFLLEENVMTLHAVGTHAQLYE